MSDALLVSNALLWIAVIALALLVLALARQVGVLHERVAPVGALALGRGPRVGEAAPGIEAPTLAGARIALGGVAADGRGTLLFFLSPTCPVCKALLPALHSVIAREDPALRLVYASDGPEPEHRAFAEAHGLDLAAYALSTELGLAHHVGKLPYAVLIDAAGVIRAQGLVNTREHLESLFEARERGVGSIQEFVARERGGSDTLTH
ncbi:MAG TPA: methylamine dehydrogenase accessory protein MauD [Myxococcota bacterium]|nr:methylamine dehydrogenase accessory protein MauD [Myxococcota bacterium]